MCCMEGDRDVGCYYYLIDKIFILVVRTTLITPSMQVFVETPVPSPTVTSMKGGPAIVQHRRLWHPVNNGHMYTDPSDETGAVSVEMGMSRQVGMESL